MNKNLLRKAIQVVLVIGIVVLSVLIYRSLMRPEQYRIMAEQRRAVVIEKMKDIRTAQLAYKSVKGFYANDFDKLKDFLINGRMPIVVKTGNVPDTLTEAQALKKGIVKRDTIYVEASKEVFKDRKNLDVKTIELIPFSTEKFQMSSDTINRGNIKVPVFVVTAPKDIFLKGIDNDPSLKEGGFFSRTMGKLLYNNLEKQFEKSTKYEDLIMGSLTEPSTDGNWE